MARMLLCLESQSVLPDVGSFGCSHHRFLPFPLPRRVIGSVQSDSFLLVKEKVNITRERTARKSIAGTADRAASSRNQLIPVQSKLDQVKPRPSQRKTAARTRAIYANKFKKIYRKQSRKPDIHLYNSCYRYINKCILQINTLMESKFCSQLLFFSGNIQPCRK